MSRRQHTAPGVSVRADRRFRRTDGRSDRHRWSGNVLRVAIWAVPVIAILLIASYGAQLALSSSLLTVTRVVVAGNVRVSPAELQELTGGLRGQPILSANLERYRRQLIDSPWIASATLWRQLPSTIKVQIMERTPMAIARLGQQLFLVDPTGVIIDEYSAAYRDFDLPIVDGLLPAAGSAAPVSQERLALTAALVSALSTRQDLRTRLSQIDVTNPYDAAVMFDNEAAWLHLGDRDFVERLRRYIELAPTFKTRFDNLDYVDLRFGDRIFVRSRPVTASGRSRG
jgi:cell division protein FtsQ